MTHVSAQAHIDADTPVDGHDLYDDGRDTVSIRLGSIHLLGPVDAVSDALTRAIGEIVAIRAGRAEAAANVPVEYESTAKYIGNDAGNGSRARAAFIGSGSRLPLPPFMRGGNG